MKLVYGGDLEPSITLMRDLRMRAHDQRPGWRKAGRHLKQAVRLQFSTEGAHLNKKRWDPLDPQYAASKKAAGFSGGILKRSGAMSKTFRTMRISKNQLIFGSDDQKAAWHQTGGGNLPRRRILNAGTGVTRDVNRILRDFIVEGRV